MTTIRAHGWGMNNRTNSASAPPTPVTGSHRTLLRIEGLLSFVAAVVAFRALGGTWTMFLVGFLVPDVTFAGYLFGPRVGAWSYNAGHALLGPALVAVVGWALAVPVLVTISALWVAHIGFDRMLGYGLKSTAGFAYTHLGELRRIPREVPQPVATS